MRVSGEMDVSAERWTGAAASYSNLSKLEQTLGELTDAIEHAKQAITYADRSGDVSRRMVSLSTHADTLHQTGRRDEAASLFREAEQMQAELQPNYTLLYSVRGFEYCELLLAEAEREAATARAGTRSDTSLADIRAVSERAVKMFEWRMPGDPLLDIALDHLTLGRAALYAAILEFQTGSSASPPSASISTAPEGLPQALFLAARELNEAVSGLRRSGQQDELPRGLLSRAWLRFVMGARTGPESTQSDLDEAFDIAERGQMRLHLADIHLYRARLFFRETKYPWDKHPDGFASAPSAAAQHGSVHSQCAPGDTTRVDGDGACAARVVGSGVHDRGDTARGPADDLVEARRLIVKCGYLRRMGELEDAEAALREFQSAAAQ
jgi:tetratricopeptide (TPR) repeat protein